MAREPPPRLRRNRMFVNLEYILMEQLADVVFITADYLEEQYNNIPEITSTLQEDLRVLKLDLFDIIETNPNFREIFSVVRPPVPTSGFLRKNRINQHTTAFNPSNTIVYRQKAAIEAAPGSSSAVVEEVTDELEEAEERKTYGQLTETAEELSEENSPSHSPEFQEESTEAMVANLNIEDSHSSGPIISTVESEESALESIDPPNTEVIKPTVAARPPASSVSSSLSCSVQQTPPPGFESPSLKTSCSLDRPPGFETSSSCSPPGFSSVKPPVQTPSVFLPQKKEECNRVNSGGQHANQLLNLLDTLNNNKEEISTKKPVQKQEHSPQPNNNEHFYEPDFEQELDNLPAPKPQKSATMKSVSSTTGRQHLEQEPFTSNHQQPVMYKINGDGLITNYLEAYRARQHLIIQIMERMEEEGQAEQSAWNKMEHIDKIVANLRRLNQLYPQGCTALQLYKFDEALRLSNSQEDEDSSNSNYYNYLSMAYLIENQMLQVSNGLFFVNPGVLSINFIQLKRNFCSNFYRLLYQLGGQAKVQDIVPKLKELVPPGCRLAADHLLRLCNRYPLLFTLKASQKDRYSLADSVISLNTSLPDWKILLDCEQTVMERTLCDCLMCDS